MKMLLGILVAASLTACGGGDPEAAVVLPKPLASIAHSKPLASPATQIPSVEEVLDWGELNYPQYFPGHQVTFAYGTLSLRYYPQTSTYIGVDSVDDNVKILSPFTGPNIVSLGTRASFAGLVFEVPHLQYSSTSQAAFYPTTSTNSYYSPLNGETQNIHYSTWSAPTMSGAAFPSDFAAQMQYNSTLAYFNMDGTVKWTRPSEGRYVTAYQNGLIASGADWTKVDVLDFNGNLKFELTFPVPPEFAGLGYTDIPVNYAKIEGDKLIIVYSYNLPVEVYAWSETTGKGALLYKTTSVIGYGRAATIQGDKIAIADTFNHQAIVESMTTGQVMASFSVFYPNDVSWHGGILYAAEEHYDRIVAFNVATKQKFVVMAPPRPELWDPAITNYPLEYCGNESPAPRSKSSDLCMGAFTLYAPNGVALRSDGMWVADTDNSRIVYVKNGQVVSVLGGLNNPVKIAEIPAQN